jgi:activator of 2-hydroxyglutaryl-CoA dehydratase
MGEENNTQVQQPATQPEAIDYSKIEAMISKGTQQKESAILKSYFEQLGMQEEEVKSAITSYKAEQSKKADEQKNAFEAMKAENEQLKAQILQSSIDAKANSIGLDMGVDKNAVAYLVKMADLSKAVDEKGEISEEAIKEAFEEVLKNVPALKSSVSSNNGFKVGVDSHQQENDKTNMLRKVAGLPPLK